ncbi:MAG: hypothetical protein U0X39_03205 [Bacteroidales bacterium]
MEARSVLDSPLIKDDKFAYESSSSGAVLPFNYNPANFSLTATGGKNFFRYLKNMNLTNDPDSLILPPDKHYYYDANELHNVRTLINLKKLNLITDLESFMKDLCTVLPSNAKLVGCFADRKSNNKNGLFSGLSNTIINLVESKTYHNLSKKDVIRILEKSGFTVIDMTEMNGLTYFYSRSINNQAEKRA